MGRAREQRAVRLYRGQIPSPGRPTVAWRQDRVRFWQAIARGLTSEDAAAEIGVSPAVGTRWFRQAGGVTRTHAPRVGPLPVVRRTRRDRVVPRPEPACERSHGAWGGRRRRSPASCGATPRRGRMTWNTGRRSRNGMPSAGPAGRRPPNWRPTSSCASTCRNGWPDRSATRRHAVPGPDGALEGAQQTPAAGPPLGEVVEPRTDRPSGQGRLSRG